VRSEIAAKTPRPPSTKYEQEKIKIGSERLIAYL
jgi:hypothetical protein